MEPWPRRHVRTGCAVCKTRKVKCDEAKPACRRCTTSGWACEYVTPVPVPKKARSIIKPKIPIANTNDSWYRPSDAISFNAQEQADFHYFREATEHAHTTCFGAQSWSRIALQMSYHEPAVRHAVFALGSFFSSALQPSHGPIRQTLSGSGSFPGDRVLENYTQALSHLRKGLVWKQQSSQTILTLCLCFAWLDLLRNERDQALDHVRAGVNILKSRPREYKDVIEPSLVQALTRIYAQAKFHGSPTSDFNIRTWLDIHPSLPLSFKDVEDARNHLDSICAGSHTLVRRLKQTTGSSRLLRKPESSEVFEISCAIEGQIQALAQWHRLSTRLPERGSYMAESNLALCLLDIQYTNQLIIHGCLNDPSEDCFDQYTCEFETVLSLVERYLSKMQTIGLFPLSIDAGLIPPLLMIVMKCPLPRLRSIAIGLLRRSPSREGLWHRDHAVAMALWKFAKEVGQQDQNQFLPADLKIHSEKLSVCSDDGKVYYKICYKLGPDGLEMVEGLDEQTARLTMAMGDMI